MALDCLYPLFPQHFKPTELFLLNNPDQAMHGAFLLLTTHCRMAGVSGNGLGN